MSSLPWTFVKRSHLHDSLPTKSASCLIQRDTDKPSAELGLAAKLRKITERTEKCFLSDILSIRFIPHKRQCHSVDAEFVRLNQLMVLLGISIKYGGNHLRLVA